MVDGNEEAGQRRRVFRQWYLPVQFNIPTSIFAVIALLITAYFIFRIAEPETHIPRISSSEQGDITANSERYETPDLFRKSEKTAEQSGILEKEMQALRLAVYLKEGLSEIKEIQETIVYLGGVVRGEESLPDKEVLTVEIGADKVNELNIKLKSFGDIKELNSPEGLEGRIVMKIELVNKQSDTR